MTCTPAVAIPTRHPTERAHAPLVAPLARLLGIAPPSDAEWRVIGEAFTLGDAPMDELVEWMYSAGMDTTRPLFDKALAEGVGAVTVDGKMIDVPVVERAQLLLERQAAIVGREAKMARVSS